MCLWNLGIGIGIGIGVGLPYFRHFWVARRGFQAGLA
jgi:hypothetical protein